jgi:hypothetical protein
MMRHFRHHHSCYSCNLEIQPNSINIVNN